jgi:hypothetical protein
MVDVMTNPATPAQPAQRVGWWRRHATARTTALVAAVCVVALTAWWGTREVLVGDQGPIRPADNITLSGMNLPVGGTATWGSVMLTNSTGKPVTLRSVQLGGGIRGTADAVRVDKVEVVDVTGGTLTGIGMVDGDGTSVIPNSLRSPVTGFVVAPGHEVSVLIRYTASRQGAWRYDYADVRYEVSGSQFTVRMPQSLGVCAGEDSCDVGKPPGL